MSHTYTHHRHHHPPLPPIKHAPPKQASTNLLAICSAGTHILSLLPLSLSLSLSFYLLVLSVSGSFRFQAALRANQRRRCARSGPAAVSGAGAQLQGCGAQGGPGDRVQHARLAPHQRRIRGRAPGPACTLTHSCAQPLGDSAPPAPPQAGPPSGCTLGFQASCRSPAPRNKAPFGKVGEAGSAPGRAPGKTRAPRRHAPPRPRARVPRPAPGAGMRWSLAEPGAGGLRLSRRLPLPPADARPPASLRSSKAFP